MRTVTCSMGISRGGYVVGPDGDLDRTASDEEIFSSGVVFHHYGVAR
jgi:hypothetical protein